MAGNGRNYLLQPHPLVTIPVKAQSGPREDRLSLKGLHKACFEADPGKDATFMRQYACRSCQAIVPENEALKGYQLSKGRFVGLSQAEIKAQVAVASEVLSVKALIPPSVVTDLRRDSSHTYYLGPQDTKTSTHLKTFELFRRQLERSDRLAVVEWVSDGHDKLGLIAARPVGCILWECYYDHEIPDLVDQFKPGTFTDPTLSTEEESIGALLFQNLFADDFDFSAHRDSYVDRVIALAMAKADGKILPEMTPAQPKAPTDLLDALKAALAMQTKPEVPKKKAKA